MATFRGLTDDEWNALSKELVDAGVRKKRTDMIRMELTIPRGLAEAIMGVVQSDYSLYDTAEDYICESLRKNLPFSGSSG